MGSIVLGTKKWGAKEKKMDCSLDKKPNKPLLHIKILAGKNKKLPLYCFAFVATLACVFGFAKLGLGLRDGFIAKVDGKLAVVLDEIEKIEGERVAEIKSIKAHLSEVNQTLIEKDKSNQQLHAMLDRVLIDVRDMESILGQANHSSAPNLQDISAGFKHDIQKEIGSIKAQVQDMLSSVADKNQDQALPFKVLSLDYWSGEPLAIISMAGKHDLIGLNAKKAGWKLMEIDMVNKKATFKNAQDRKIIVKADNK